MKNILKFAIIVFSFAVFMIGNFNYKSANICYGEPQNLTTAKSMCVMEKTSKRILYEKDSDIKLPQASLTKIITAIVAIENNGDLNRIIEIPKEATGIEGSSIYLKAGEHLSILDLLYGLMLRSGNDSAVALALATSGSVENFIDLANEFCRKIGAINTHLVTCNGLDDKNHYTTAKDMALITCYALNNVTFREIVGTVSHDIPNELGKSEFRHLKNKNKLLSTMEGATGVKTGYTRNAGRCFVGSASKNGMEVVCVVLNCGPMFEETQALLTKALNEFEMVHFIEPFDNFDIPIDNAIQQNVKLCVKNGFSYPLTQTEKSNINIITNLPEMLTAPIENDCAVGEIQIFLANDLIFSEKIYTINAVEGNDYLSKLTKILKGMA